MVLRSDHRPSMPRWIKGGRAVHASLTLLHNDSTFVTNKRLTREERSDGRVNPLEASPQFSHHLSCRMSSGLVTHKKSHTPSVTAREFYTKNGR